MRSEMAEVTGFFAAIWHVAFLEDLLQGTLRRRMAEADVRFAIEEIFMIPENSGVTDCSWVVVGGSGGLGRPVVEALAQAIRAGRTTSKVIITSRSRATAEQVANEIDPERVIGLGMDATSDESVNAFWAEAQSYRPRRFAYVAGGVQKDSRTLPGKTVQDIPMSEIVNQFEVTLFAPIRVQHIIGNGMIAQNLGTDGKLNADLVFIHTSSASAVHPLPNVGPYSAAMRGIDSMVESWQRELAGLYGPLVRVVGVRPGFVPTTQNSSLLLDPSAEDGLTARGRTVSAGAMLNRMGTAEEIAGLYLFLASRRAGFVAGTVFDADGGFNHRSVL